MGRKDRDIKRTEPSSSEGDWGRETCQRIGNQHSFKSSLYPVNLKLNAFDLNVTAVWTITAIVIQQNCFSVHLHRRYDSFCQCHKYVTLYTELENKVH